MIIFLIIWSLINSLIAIAAFRGAYINYKKIEVIKSWYPFCEILKMKIDRGDGEE